MQKRKDLHTLCDDSLSAIISARDNAVAQVDQKIRAATQANATNAGNFIANFFRSTVIFHDFQNRKKYESHIERYETFRVEIRRIASLAIGRINTINNGWSVVRMDNIDNCTKIVNDSKQEAISKIERMASQKWWRNR